MPNEVTLLLMFANTCLTVVALFATLRLTNAMSRLVDQIDDVEEVEI